MSDLNDFFKTLYLTPMADEYVVNQCPALKYIDRRTDFTSTRMDVPVYGSNNARVGADFEMAQTGSNADQSTGAVYTIPQRTLYGFYNISGQQWSNFSEGSDKSAFLDQSKAAVKQTFESMGDNAAKCFYGSGRIILGQVATGTATPITVGSFTSAALIGKGSALRFGPNADGTSLRAGIAKVTSVDSSTRTVVFTGTVTGLAVNDYIFPANDVAVPTATGLEAYNGATPIVVNGLDQRDDPFSYSGHRYNATGQTLRHGITRALAEHRLLAKGGAQLSVLFMNPLDVLRLQDELPNGLPTSVVTANAAYKDYQLKIDSFAFGGVKVVEDPYCPEGLARGISKDAMVMLTCGTFNGGSNGIGKLDDRDGRNLRFAPRGDNFEMRFFSYWNLSAKRPPGLLRIQLPAAV
jgi:hypothetical protein